jgi:hypothetical protein
MTGQLTNSLTGQTLEFPYGGATASPFTFSRSVPDTGAPALLSGWSATFTSGNNSATTVFTDIPSAQQQLGFVTNVAFSGSTLTPTITWDAPNGTAVDGYRIRLWDKSRRVGGMADLVWGGVSTTTGLATIPAVFGSTTTPLTLDFTHNYVIEILALDKRDETSASLGNPNLVARSRSFFDFTPVLGMPDRRYLPTAGPDGVYHYDINVVGGAMTYIDPLVAVGYDYEIGVGDPKIRSVLLPANIGDGSYDIFTFAPGGSLNLVAHDWRGGDIFDFGATGVDRFRVSGIESSADLNPNNVNAFVAGLTFTNDGRFTGTQTPLSVEVAVAEPASIAVLTLGLIGLAMLRTHRPSKKMTVAAMYEKQAWAHWS